MEERRMNSFDNPYRENPLDNPIGTPFGRQRPVAPPETIEAIKLWTRQTLALSEDTALSVGQFGCSKPGCPRNMTTILVMSENAPTRKISIHKSITDVCESDVQEAVLDPRNAAP